MSPKESFDNDLKETVVDPEDLEGVEIISGLPDFLAKQKEIDDHKKLENREPSPALVEFFKNKMRPSGK